jgi:S1-C subfamily serine protease
LVAARRVRQLRVESEVFHQPSLLSSPELDRALESLPGDVRGLLGWNVLQNVEIGLDAVRDGSAVLELRRFEDTSHVLREWVGLGLRGARVDAPIPGWRVDGFWSHSPGREAGLRPGDVLLDLFSAPKGRAGATVELQVWRLADGRTEPLAVQLGDLLSDVR